MNVLTTEGLKIDYSVHLDRFSIIVNNEWISISKTAFELLNAISFSKNEFERVVIQQSGSEIEIIKLLENYLLTFRSKTLTTNQVLTKTVMEILNENHDRIINAVRVETNRRTANRNIVKKLKFGSVNKGNLLCNEDLKYILFKLKK